MLNNLIGETTNIEKKEEVEKKKIKNWLKTISAFGNGNGGKLIFGIKDNGEIVGVENFKSDMEFISEAIKVHIEAIPETIIENIEVENKNLILVEVYSGNQTPYYYVGNGNKIAYTRIGNESVVVQSYMLNNLILKGKNQTYDNLITDINIENVSFSKLKATYYWNTKLEFLSTDFESFGLVKNGKLTNAGALLADERVVYHSRIFCTRWKGLDKSCGIIEAIDDREIEGGIIYLLQEAVNFVISNSKKMWKKTNNSRLEFPEYPERAVQEAIVNAIIHRDYCMVGGEIHIDMYDDRLEITSPGGMYNGKKIQDMNKEEMVSYRRNPIIADIFTRLKLMERRGSGLKKIFDAYCNSDNYSEKKEVIFKSDTDEFKVIMKNLNYKENYNTDILEALIRKSSKINEKKKMLEIQENRILKYLEDNGEITRIQVQELLDVSRRRAIYLLKTLIEKKKIIVLGTNRKTKYKIL